MACPPSCEDDLGHYQHLDEEVSDLFHRAARADSSLAIRLLRKAERLRDEADRARRRNAFACRQIQTALLAGGF